MAECSKTEETVTIITPTYRLDLTQEEAETLVSLFGMVGGPPTGSRGLVDGMGDALISAGIDASVARRAHPKDPNTSVYFRD